MSIVDSTWWRGPWRWAWKVQDDQSRDERHGVAATRERANERIEQAKAELEAR